MTITKASDPKRPFVVAPHAPVDEDAALARPLEELAAVSRVLDKLSRPAIDLDAILRELAADTSAIVGASGVAIALTQANKKAICRASHGSAGPELGAVIDVTSGITGECFRTAVTVVCDDAETDARVNASVCRELGVRSILVVPLVARGDVLGVLEAFSPERKAFSEANVATSQRLAGLVSCACVSARVVNTVPSVNKPAYAVPPAPTAPSFCGEFQSDEYHPERRRVLWRLAVLALLVLALGWWGWRSYKPFSYVSVQNPPLVSSPVRQSSHSSLSADAVLALRSRAEEGDPDAQFALGSAYAEGDGVEQNYKEAADLFSEAAEQSNVPAQAVLGVLYATGRGVPQDYVTAYMWATLAAGSGDQLSTDQIAMLASHLTREQIAKAERQASDWSKRHGAAARTPKPVAKHR